MQKIINWFTVHILLTYNCLFNFIIGDRGGGKSFGTLKFCVERFIKKGEQFVYLRRWERELDDSLPTLFDALRKEGLFPDHELSVKGTNFYCDGKQMGFAVALSTSMKKKSVNYSNVSWIIFEEFMIDGVGSNRYIAAGDQEVTVFENLYETIARLRPGVRVFFVANAFSMVNIYFTRYKIRLKPPYKTYNKIGNIMVCIWHDESYIEEKKKTAFYDIVKGTEFARHAYENQFYLDSDHFIKKRPADAEFHFAYMYMGKIYGVWVDWNEGNFYITNKAGSVNSTNVIALTLDDNRPNNINIRRVRQLPFMVGFRRAVDENRVFYDNLETYANIKEAVYLLRTIT